MTKVFNENESDARKTWIAEYNPLGYKKFVNDLPISKIGISDYLNNYTIQFSIADNERSLPNVMDGLKECQRKVLYACFKKKLTKTPIKVAQLSGYVSEKTNYHHGEESLNGTITGMASCFVGGNNLPLLTRKGFFGSRLKGGKDTAKPRYIFTMLEKITRLIYRPEDDNLLKRVIDDGDIVEPEFYVPIIPMILVNPSSGIGTGWSSTIPAFNPTDLCNCIKIWLENDCNRYDTNNTDLFPSLVPWYRGFTGRIEKDKGDRFTTYGIIERKNDTSVYVKELPIGRWTDDFKNKMEDHLEKKELKKIDNNSTMWEVKFVLHESEDGMSCNEKNLKLFTYLGTGNLVAWDEHNHIKKFDTPENIVEHFCNVRYTYYKLRKINQIKELNYDLLLLSNKRRFIDEVMNKKIIVFKKKTSILETELEQAGYMKDTKIIESPDSDDNDDEVKDVDITVKGGYNYLIRIPVSTFTEEGLKKFDEEYIKVQDQIHALEKMTEKSIWLTEIEELLVAYDEMQKNLAKEKTIKKSGEKSETFGEKIISKKKKVTK
jgi:DNA topoisomerase-2